ncbi:hypothetical protein KKI24_16185 [bacterium]|nr:hypothetical protein [bacterium]
MALSDPHYSAQVIDPDGNPYYFDDIGCAILWLRRQPWQKKARTWVNDVHTKEWIDAEKASWMYGDPKTPMGYGFSATLQPVKKPMTFETVKKWMYIGKTLVRENTARHLGLDNQSPVTVGPSLKRSTPENTLENRKKNERTQPKK